VDNNAHKSIRPPHFWEKVEMFQMWNC
jgi:hypothetical protein